MKVLLVTYYWPPAGGVSVLRWIEMVKEWSKLGYDITVVHPKNASYPIVDHTEHTWLRKVKQVSVPIMEFQGIKSILGFKGKAGNEIFTDKKNWLKRLVLYIRSNLFIPDARCLWVKPVVKKVKQILAQESYDVLITNGTPHSCHLVGLDIKKANNEIKWVADFRDPWMEIDYFKDLSLSQASYKKHERLEREVLDTADMVTTVSPSWAELFRDKGAQNVQVFTNGYDEEKFDLKKSIEVNQVFTIRHIGTIDYDRFPRQLIECVERQQAITLEFAGKIAAEVRQDLEKNKVTDLGYVDHDKAVELMLSADALLLCNSQLGAVEGRIPAKVFEYLAARKPILYIGSMQNDAWRIIDELGMGIHLDYTSSLDDIYAALKKLRTSKIRESKESDKYTRKHIARSFSNRILELIA